MSGEGLEGSLCAGTTRLSEAGGVRGVGHEWGAVESRREWPLQPLPFLWLAWLPFSWLVESGCACRQPVGGLDIHLWALGG